MGRFSKIRQAKVSGTGSYFVPGMYKVRIKTTKMVESSKDTGQEFFVIETEVLESDNPKIPVGGDRSQVIPMDETMTLPNIKGFIAAASGVDPLDDDIDDKVEKFWSKAVGQSLSYDQIADLMVDGNPLEGVELELECVEIITRGKGQPFTKHNWQPREV